MSRSDRRRWWQSLLSNGAGNAQDHLATVEAGKPADLVIMDEKPLDSIRNTNTILYVMRNGRVYDDGTPDEARPRQRPLLAQGSRSDEPVGAAMKEPQGVRI